MSSISEGLAKEIIQLLLDHLNQANLKICQATIEWLTKSLFGNQNSREQRKLGTTQGSITQCTLYGKQSLWKNVIIAMFKERIGLGFDYYKVMAYMLLPFINQIFCLLRMIPPKKIVLYPKRPTPLIFNYLTFPLQISTIRRISARTILEKDCPGYCKLCKLFWCKHTIAYLQHYPKMDDGI